MPPFQHALAPSLPSATVHRVLFAALLLFLTPLAAHAQSGQGNPNGGSNNPEQSAPVVLTVSVAPDRVPITSGTATLTWSGQNARYCSVDGVSRAASGSATVGPWTTAGAKSILVECWNNGKAGYAANTVTVTVYNVAKPVIKTTLSKSLLEANVDKFTVTYSATNAKSCMLAGTKYPTSGSATLGPYPAGKHSLTFSCSGDGGTTSHTINWEAINAVTLSASVSPSTITANGSDTARVSWTSAHADSCTLDGANAAKSGSRSFGPYSYTEAGSKSATVACKNRLGSKTSTVNWTVNALAPSVSVTLSQNPVVADVDTVKLSWTSSDSDYCSYGGSRRGVSGMVSNLGPFSAGNHAFTVSCTGTGGTTSDTVTLTAEEPAPPPTVTVSLDPDTITADTGTSTLKWESEHATSCSRNDSTVATSGSARVGPYSQGSYTFTVSCTGPGGSASGSATLTVDPPPKPDAPEVTASLDPTTITANTGKSTLTWSSVRANSCDLDGSPVSTSGNKQVGPYAKGAYRFTVTCTGAGGTDRATARLTVAPLPTVTVGLAKASVTANKDKVEMTWSSTDATACQYGSDTLSTGGTREVGPFAEGMHDVTVSCTGDGGTASDSASLTAVKETGEPDNDMDGIPDSEDPDDDNDGMPDTWEQTHQLNPLDASDANQDADGDGHTNLEEYTRGSDPKWNLSKPGSIPETEPGFNEFYTAQKGLIDGDQLEDILIRNPTSGILPAVSEFVLIQQTDGGFELKDPDDITTAAASRLTSINQAIRLHDLNADGVMDLYLWDLDRYIEGADDHLVFGNYGEQYRIPTDDVRFSDYKTEFFEQVEAWIEDDDYFYNNARAAALVPIVEEGDSALLADPVTKQVLIGLEPLDLSDAKLREYGCELNNYKCVPVRADRTDLLVDTGGLGVYYSTVPFKVIVVDTIDDSTDPDYWGIMRLKFSPSLLYRVPDYSEFNRHAMLFVYYLNNTIFQDFSPIYPGTIRARRVSQGLEWALESAIFANGLWAADTGVFPEIGDYTLAEGNAQDVLFILDVVRKLICELEGGCEDSDIEYTRPSPGELPPRRCMENDGEDCPDADPAVFPLPDQCSADANNPGDVRLSSLGGDSLKLSNKPAMPAATLTATVSEFSTEECVVTSIVWSATLGSRMVGGTRSHPPADQEPYRHQFTSTKVFAESDQQQSIANTWTIPWDDLISGGRLVVSATLNFSINNRMTESVTVSRELDIRGMYGYMTSQIKTITGESLEKLAVAWQESHHHQFDSKGNPRLGGGDGWGIMQLDNIPNVTLMEPHFWDWRANVREGVKYLEETLYPETVSWLRVWYKEDDPLAPMDKISPGKDHPWGWSPHELELDENVKRIWNDSFSQYNTGKRLYSPDGAGGMERCTATKGDKNYPNMRFDGCDYKDIIRCHMDNKSWEKEQTVDKMCRQSIYEDSDD